MRHFSVLAGLALSLALASCAVEQHATTFSPIQTDPAGTGRLHTLTAGVDVTFGTGYSRQLKQGSQWTDVGRVEAGEVFKPHNDVFTLEGAHIHEAYLVVSDQHLVGFYLPAEKTFSPLKPSILLPLN